MKKSLFKSGFTLAEMVVCLAIISVITTVLLGNRARFSERLSLKNQTYNAVLYFRQAQVYSLGVRGNTSASFGISYGVHFDPTYPLNQFRFFTDANDNGTFDSGETYELVNLSNGITIASVCSDNGTNCYGTTGNFRSMSITFKRPQSNAIMKFMNGGGQPTPGAVPPAVINLISQTGLTSSIKIETTGAISIQGL